MVMFNPEIIKKSQPYDTEEGWLALEGTRPARRWRSIKVRWQHEKFQERLKTFTGWTAQIIPVSYTHLDVYKRQIWNTVRAAAAIRSYAAICLQKQYGFHPIQVYRRKKDFSLPLTALWMKYASMGLFLSLIHIFVKSLQNLL